MGDDEGALAAVELRDERAELRASFLPRAGMLCHSLRHRGVELLAQNAGLEAYVQRGKTLGIPLLYPWANRLADFSYAAAGRAVEFPRAGAPIALDPNGLPIHGVIGGRMQWEPEPLADGAAAGEGSEGRRALAARLRWRESDGARFAVFPFAHDVLYEARLAAGALQIAVTVAASCGERVPVAFGFHPYLAPAEVPRERWRVALPAMRPLLLDARQIPVGAGEPLPARELELGAHQFDDGFDALAAGARFTLRADARELAIELIEGYPCAQLYAPRERATICFEPMTAPANALRSGAALTVLEPGERYRARFALRVDARSL
jgi:galactose mutarotase-like enzyme